MKTLKIFIGLLFIIIFFSNGCDSSTEPKQSFDYMSLNVGDIREFYNQDNSTYRIVKIIGKSKRTDNQEVYIAEWSSSLTGDSLIDTSYYFIKDGYFRTTKLDTTNYGQIMDINPFYEQRLAKINPKDGDTWSSIEGLPDSTIKFYFRASFIERQTTPAGTFENVFRFHLGAVITTYYAKGYGHIGASISSETNYLIIAANYIKANNKEIGNFIPFDVLPKRIKSKVFLKQINPLGEIIK